MKGNIIYKEVNGKIVPVDEPRPTPKKIENETKAKSS